MFYFDKKIYYIDYYENGSRISNAGFISLTFKDDDCRVHVGIRNLPGAESRMCRWFGLINSEQVFLEEFRVEKGEADFVNSYKRNSLGRTEVDFSTLEGFYFALGKRRWGSCFFRNIKQRMEPTFQEKPEKKTAQDNFRDGISGDADDGQSAVAEHDSDREPDNGWNGKTETDLYYVALNGNSESDIHDREWNGSQKNDQYDGGISASSEDGFGRGGYSGSLEDAFYDGGYGDSPEDAYQDGGYGESPEDAYQDGGYGDSPEDAYQDGAYGDSPEDAYQDGRYGSNPESGLRGSEWSGRLEEAPSEAAADAKIRNDSGRASRVQQPVHRTTWEELTETHQLVHPFEDQGDYISINPFTLKLLAPEYRKLANNSFLLHGFYNYRHLILGYYQDEERQGYYIGVPGTFDEREQMVAEMFGFEGYEPAGGVGYYMRRVEF